jgi:hypothetical protein
MEENLSNEKIDKIMFRYFDGKFKDCFYGDEPIKSGGRWTGFWDKNNNDLLLGHPEDEGNELWFSNGPTFGHGNEILGISQSEYHLSMIRYINKKYPEVEIGRIM